MTILEIVFACMTLMSFVVLIVVFLFATKLAELLAESHETFRTMLYEHRGPSPFEPVTMARPFIPWWSSRTVPEQEIESGESHIPSPFGPDHDDWREPALTQPPLLAAKSKLRELDDEPAILPKSESPSRG